MNGNFSKVDIINFGKTISFLANRQTFGLSIKVIIFIVDSVFLTVVIENEKEIYKQVISYIGKGY